MRRGSGRNGFTVIELALVVAIIGIMSAIAINGYTGFQKNSRIKASEENFDIASRLVSSELYLCSVSPSEVKNSVVSVLNQNKKSPWDVMSAAFAEDASISDASPGKAVGKGQVAISKSDLQSLCGISNAVVYIHVDKNGDALSDFGLTLRP